MPLVKVSDMVTSSLLGVPILESEGFGTA